jgi:hypothetical protein
MMKFMTFSVATAALLLSGCCRFLGVCTSASVQSSIAPPGVIAGGGVASPQQNNGNQPIALR